MEVAVGALLDGRYRVESVLSRREGAGALRVLDVESSSPALLKWAVTSHSLLTEELRAERAAAMRVTHPRLVGYRDHGEIGGADERTEYLILSWVDGLELGEFARGRRWSEVAAVFADALRGLLALHDAGLRHGDFKPANVIADARGRGVLIDLGSSRPLTLPAAATSGTPGFLSAEALRGAPDARSDLFAVGRSLQSVGGLLEGGLPPEVGSLAELLQSHSADARPVDVASALFALGARVSQGVLRSDLVGRERASRDIEAWLEAFARGDSAPRVLACVGAPGTGRSRLLLELRRRVLGDMRVLSAATHGEQPVTLLLGRAAGVTGTGLSLAIAAAGRLAEAPRQTLLVIDDLDRLPASEQRLALAVARVATGHCAVALSSTEQPPLDHACMVAVEALTPRELERWVRAPLSSHALHELHARTRGLPALVVAQLGARSLDERWSLPDAAVSAEELALAAQGLDITVRNALARLAWRSCLELDQLDASEASTLDVPEQCIASGVVVRDAVGWCVPSRALSRALLDAVGAGAARTAALAAYRELAEQLQRAEPARSAGLALQVIQIALECGELDEAWSVFRAGSGFERHPATLCRAAQQLLARPADAEEWLSLGETLERAGAAELGLRALARARRSGLSDEQLVRYSLAAAAGYESGGRPGLALRRLAPLAGAALSGVARATLAHRRAMIELKLGNPGEALRETEMGLALAESGAGISDDLRADLLADRLTALGYGGDEVKTQQARAALSRLPRSSLSPRCNCRLHSSCGFLHYRRGELPLAAECYRAAGEIARANELEDLLIASTTNQAVTLHQLGDWALALASYEQARELVQAAGMRTNAQFLGFNLARLYLDIGSPEDADLHARAALLVCQREGNDFLALACRTVILLSQELRCPAVETPFAELTEVASAFEQREQWREVAEVATIHGLWLVERGDRTGAALVLARAEAACEKSGRAGDIEAPIASLRARIAAAALDANGVGIWVGRARAAAESSTRRALLAEVETESALCWAELDPARSITHRERATALWQPIGDALPARLRERFFAHPRRKFAFAQPALTAEPVNSSPQGRGRRPSSNEIERHRSLLAALRRMNRAQTSREVLEIAVDHAVELFGAERGFILQGAGPRASLEVAAARNMARLELDDAHGFSRSIADAVARTCEPVTTIDALSDARFAGQRSVQSLRLKSVACYPIQTHQAVAGVLYLDHRLREGCFASADSELLSTFAEHIGVTLSNVQQRMALEDKAKGLEERLKQEQARAASSPSSARATAEIPGFSGMVGSSLSMQRVFGLVQRLAASAVPVLVSGPSGAGKELVARAIHREGARKNAAFVAINCGALPDALLEAELFGYKKGAFTGAVHDHPGLFVQADGGTLFLDELGETSAALQVKLLRVLQEGELRPLGGRKAVSVNVRIIGASNRDLRQAAARGEFREDLFYRIAVVEVRVPPLSERREDLPLLVRSILQKNAERLGRQVPGVSPAAMQALLAHAWPGNVRELENTLTKALVLADTDLLQEKDLDIDRRDVTPSGAVPPDQPQVVDARDGSRDPRRKEAGRIRDALAATGNNVVRAAKLLGIPRASFYRKLGRYGISPR